MHKIGHSARSWPDKSPKGSARSNVVTNGPKVLDCTCSQETDIQGGKMFSHSRSYGPTWNNAFCSRGSLWALFDGPSLFHTSFNL